MCVCIIIHFCLFVAICVGSPRVLEKDACWKRNHVQCRIQGESPFPNTHSLFLSPSSSFGPISPSLSPSPLLLHIHTAMFSLSFVQVPSSGREYGSVWLKVDGQPQNVTDTLVSEGMVEVRQTGRTSE